MQRSQCAIEQLVKWLLKLFYWKIFPEEAEMSLGSGLKARAQMKLSQIEISKPTFLQAKKCLLVKVKSTKIG